MVIMAVTIGLTLDNRVVNRIATEIADSSAPVSRATKGNIERTTRKNRNLGSKL